MLASLAAVLVAGFAGGAFWFLRSAAPQPVAVDPGSPAGVPGPTTPPEAEPGDTRGLELAEDETPEFTSLETTVIFPLDVRL